jgi:hypothetical protein
MSSAEDWVVMIDPSFFYSHNGQAEEPRLYYGELANFSPPKEQIASHEALLT